MRKILATLFVVILFVIAGAIIGSKYKYNIFSLMTGQSNIVTADDEITAARNTYISAFKAEQNNDLIKADELYTQAFRMYLPLAESGVDEAQSILGMMYEDGKGTAQDFVKAAKWYRKAAEQEDLVAQRQLGVHYREGLGIPRDYNEAIKWFLKASEQGYWSAQIDLAEMYEMGWGTPKNYISAYAWYDVAVPLVPHDRVREDIVRIRDEIAKEMTKNQISEAQRLSQEWTSRLPEDKPF